MKFNDYFEYFRNSNISLCQNDPANLYAKEEGNKTISKQVDSFLRLGSAPWRRLCRDYLVILLRLYSSAILDILSII